VQIGFHGGLSERPRQNRHVIQATKAAAAHVFSVATQSNITLLIVPEAAYYTFLGLLSALETTRKLDYVTIREQQERCQKFGEQYGA
jgi:hypothetical protein